MNEIIIAGLGIGLVAMGTATILLQAQVTRQRKHQAEMNRAFHQMLDAQISINQANMKLSTSTNERLQLVERYLVERTKK